MIVDDKGGKFTTAVTRYLLLFGETQAEVLYEKVNATAYPTTFGISEFFNRMDGMVRQGMVREEDGPSASGKESVTRFYRLAQGETTTAKPPKHAQLPGGPSETEVNAGVLALI